MNLDDLITEKYEQLNSQSFIEFKENELDGFRVDQIEHIVNIFHGQALMKLPETEIRFFEWLKTADRPTWDDLWGDEEDMYLVSIDLLPQFIDGKNGFPICDLIDEPNFWFAERHIKPAGRKALEKILAKLNDNKKLNAEELFLFEMTIAPIDIWHFCYRYKIHLKMVKDAIEEMVYKGWLVHLTDREDLVKYLDV